MESFISVILRTCVIFLLAFIFIRIRGKHQLGQMSLFDTVIIIAFGSAVGDVMIYPESVVSLADSAVAMGTLVMLVMIIEKTLNKTPKSITHLVYGQESVVVYNGQIIEENFNKINITEEQLISRLREKGLQDIHDAKIVRFEPDGDLSVEKFKEKKEE